MAIEKVKEYVNSARAEFPEITNELLDNDGKIYYMNGNDGTDFDWDWNDRLCEFVVFGKNEMGFIKVFVHKDDTMEGYVYADFGMVPTKKLPVVHLNDGESEELFKQMIRTADKNNLWDKTLDELGL